jgi:proteasome lid subunit RPN8/RPN11
LLTNLIYPTEWAALEAIKAIGVEFAPEEACGILVQEAFTEWRVVQLQNRAPDPTTSYKIDPATIAQIVKSPEMWYQKTQVWHTHPGGMVGPSQGDLDYKAEGVRYVVVTIPDGEYRRF